MRERKHLAKLQNVHNRGRTVYLFERQDDNSLTVREDNSYRPYFYEPDPLGEFVAYDGERVRKIICNAPKDVGDQRTSRSYEADIPFPKRYVIDKIDEFEVCPLKYFFFDIEVLTKDMPDANKANKPVSCISLHNPMTKEMKTWYLPDYNNDTELLDDFVDYIKAEKPDLLLAWNVSFDYTYLSNRINDFANRISPIGQARYGQDKIMYPAGISILDYMAMFKRVSMREPSYALDKISQKYLKEKAWPKTEFGEINDLIKEKNINDVVRMMKIEEKFNVLGYFDEFRRFTGCFWEDVCMNSRILDMYVLKEAGKRGMILPSTIQNKETGFDLEGAYRRAEVGVFNDLYKADVGSMYPNQLINFCLDAQNIVDEPNERTVYVNGIYVEQNRDALLPSIAQNLIDNKNILKAELKLTPDNTILKMRYDACKTIVNSLYGVMAFPTFRLYNFDIASTITHLARELLRYAESMMIEEGCKVRYTDTDALMYEAEEDETDFLNRIVLDWGLLMYNKPDINIEFESEGMFEKILILGKCHYYGYLKDREKPEIKGMEIKRSSSSKYEAYFQEKLINKILDKESKAGIIEWIKEEHLLIKGRPLTEIAFPCRIANKVYKNDPIFVRAYRNSKKAFNKFHVSKGENFHYLYVKSFGYDDEGKAMNVLAIKEDTKIGDIEVEWSDIIRRTIISKTENIFEALHWGDIKLLLSNQQTLF